MYKRSIVVVAFVLLAGAAVASMFFAPCGCYAGSPITEVPSRCLKELGPRYAP